MSGGPEVEGTDASPVPEDAAGADTAGAVPGALLPPLEVDDDALRRGVAAVLFIADEPLTVDAVAETLGVDRVRVADAFTGVVAALADLPLGFEVREVAGGWRMMTAPSARPVLERWLIGARHGRLTQAALETLAVIAYRQPIARATVGEIRGVNPDGALRSLVARGLVAEVGREDGPGQAVLFGTTAQFLERMGLRSLSDLPPLPPYLPDGPAPDEPEAGGLVELRRRLRDGTERLGGGPAPRASQGGLLAAAGAMADSDDDDDDVAMPPPAVRSRPREDEAIGPLSERLEQAARSAMGRLRSIRPERDDDAGSDTTPVTGEPDPEARVDRGGAGETDG
jgi:segregation and condensation protein B